MIKLYSLFLFLLGNIALAQITDTGSKVGIGTASPKAKLHIVGDLYLQGTEAYPNGSMITRLGWRGHSLIVGTPIDAYAHNIIELKPGGSTRGQLASIMKFYQALGPNDQELRAQISSEKSHPTFFNAGNVGIGTSTPDAKLAVNGSIHAQEVKIDMKGWADYVFEDRYELTPLDEVEKHIAEKGHLKDIPSAKEVMEYGVLLGDMNVRLLRKIEELMLYTIQQEKKLLLQTKEIGELRIQVDEIMKAHNQKM